MLYSQFTIGKVKQDFQLTTLEGIRFFPDSLETSVSSGTQWRFLKLEGQIVTIDLIDYLLPPIEQILSFLVWMLKAG